MTEKFSSEFRIFMLEHGLESQEVADILLLKQQTIRLWMKQDNPSESAVRYFALLKKIVLLEAKILATEEEAEKTVFAK